ncbi:universal stress protein [Actinoplanes sp. TBRC 11911]|uniref:universal stress protein n=1 Tax=Actinoplanes sp. TBRC 11911 TaxID=2729386 RepID=UPI00145D8AAD|nr:universal stress protein [Actinoplanes sp. TBRC 11911]NMO57288.1 universal stress protein [Actinoplanes sp. TBRC 11911]
MSPSPIVVGYDRSVEAKLAAAWALDEAARTGAAVEFLYAYEWPEWLPAASMVPATSVWPDTATDHAIKQALDEAVATALSTHPDVRTKISLLHNSAALALIDRSAHAGLVVVGSRGHSAVTNLLGSVSTALTARAQCPVIVVRGEPSPTAPVVVGVDDSPSSHTALVFAAGEAAARNVPLRIVRAWTPVTGLWAGTPMETRTVLESERHAFDELVATWRQKYPNLPITAEAVVDHPANALIEASKTAQLLVVGTRGRGSVRAMLLGSVSQHLLRNAACTVAVAHDREV